tara:strand:- start:50 stop:370 length:321 start_codon:yes stop_codon:yes gene_type:complete
MKYVVDIDGTICYPGKGEEKYTHATPRTERICQINDLYIKGNEVIYFTARGMGRHNNDRQKAYDEFYEFTLKQLCDWGCMFNDLWLGKPSADYYIDDKGVHDGDFF